MKGFVLFLFLFLVLLGCVPTAVSEIVNNPTVTATAVPTETPTTIPVTPTQTPNPTNMPAVKPTRSTPTPTATPLDFPEIWANSMTNSDYGVVWSVPVNWQEIIVSALSPDFVFWQAWTNNLETASAELPSGQMRLTLHIENNDSDVPNGAEQRTLWGVSVWTQEILGTNADDFDLRLSLTAVREPYQYHYQLDCSQFEQASASAQAAFTAF